MKHQEIELTEGYLTVKVPGGTVLISASQVDLRTRNPAVVVEVESKYKVAKVDQDGYLWTVLEPRTYAKTGQVIMQSRKPGEPAPTD